MPIKTSYSLVDLDGKTLYIFERDMAHVSVGTTVQVHYPDHNTSRIFRVVEVKERRIGNPTVAFDRRFTARELHFIDLRSDRWGKNHGHH